MKSENHRATSLEIWRSAIIYAVCIVLFAGAALAATHARQIPSGEKAKVKGTIMGRDGEKVSVQDSKDGSLVIVALTDDTKIERKKEWLRHKEMDMTALLPGLTIDAEGVGNDKGQLEAKKVTFNPDDFVIAVAQEKQILHTEAAANSAQATADQGVAAAGAAQASANMAQNTADQAGATAAAATAAGQANAAAVNKVNQRVSELDDYQTVSKVELYYASGKYTLDDAAKAELDKLAATALQQEGYMIEIAGYASSTGSKEANQRLSEERAAVVAEYLRNNKNIPIRRILAPVGYGVTHPEASNKDSKGRELNRRVDVTILVNKGVSAGE